MLDLGQKAITSNFSCLFTLKIQKSQRISVPTVQLDYSLMAIDGPITKNRRPVGTPLEHEGLD